MSYNNVMCLVRGDETDAGAIDTAVDLIEGNNRSIRFVYVIEVGRRFALGEPDTRSYNFAEQVLRQAEQMSGLRPVAKGSILQSRSIGPVLVREALDFGADVIVAAAKVVTKSNGKSIDDAAEYLMANAPCAVVLVRAAVPGFEVIADHRDSQRTTVSALRD